MSWEVDLIEWAQRAFGSFGAAAGKVFSFFGGETGILLVVLIVAFCWKKDVGMRLALIIASVNAFLPMIKTAVLRPRPYMEHPDRVKPLALVETSAAADDVAAQGYSFPSMHAASASALYGSLALKIRKAWAWIASIAITLLIGVSRVMVGMHYPTDVLTGWAIGLACVGLYALLEKLVKQMWLRPVILVILALPGVFFVRTQDYYTALGLLIGAAAALPFENRFVRYQDTTNLWARVIRPLGAFGIYFALNTLLKLPFGKEFLSRAELLPLLIRAARYAVIVFVIFALYPKLFPLFEKIGGTKGGNAPVSPEEKL